MNEFSLSEICNEVRRDFAEQTRNHVQLIENTYFALQALCAEGLQLIPPSKWDLRYNSLFRFDIDSAKDLCAVRRALGPVVESSRQPVDGKRCWIYRAFRPKDERYHHFIFRFQQKLPKGGKCRIVHTRRTYRSSALVCES